MSKCNVLGKKTVVAQWFFRQFLTSECYNITPSKIQLLCVTGTHICREESPTICSITSQRLPGTNPGVFRRSQSIGGRSPVQSISWSAPDWNPDHRSVHPSWKAEPENGWQYLLEKGFLTTSWMTNLISCVILTPETKNNYFYRKENDHENHRFCYVL